MLKWALRIRNVRKEAEGLYKCQVSSNSLVQEKLIPLKVEETPNDIYGDQGLLVFLVGTYKLGLQRVTTAYRINSVKR